MPIDPNAELTLVETIDDLLDLRAWLGERREFLACDIETSGLNLGHDRVRLLQLGDPHRGFAFSWEDWRGVAKEVLPRYQGRIAFHNAAFDLAFLEREGVHVPQASVHDTMVMAHLLEPRFGIGLKPSAARYVDKAAWMGKNALDDAMRGGGWDWGTIPVDHPAYWFYSVFDTTLTSALAEQLWPKVVEGGYREIYEIELACIHVLRDARLAGMAIDLDYISRKKAELLTDLSRLEQLIPFEPGKNRQALAYFEREGACRRYGKYLKDWWPFRTKSSEVSLEDEALAAFQDRFDVIPPLREWRSKNKLLTSYIRTMEAQHVEGVLHCNIKQVGARTGRMSITDPALQTLPRGRAIRDAFVAREGHHLVLADYAQMEARMMAADAGCQSMIDAFIRDEDLHTWTAGLVYHQGAQELVDPLERQIAKNVGYARMYGAGAATIAFTYGLTEADVEAFMGRFNDLFPEIQMYMNRIIQTVAEREHQEKLGYIRTVLGRRCPVDKGEWFKAVNYRIQGSGGDVLKRKIVQLDWAGLGEFIRLPVHDEVILEVPDEQIGEVLRVVRDVMPETELFSCPLAIDTDVCERWGEHYERDPDKRTHWDHASSSD